MKDRKLKKYRCWFKCPYLVEEKDCVTTDPHPIYQESSYCKLGRYSVFGYSGYSHSEDGTPCKKCKLPINRKWMHETLMRSKEYNRLSKAYDNAYKNVRKVYVKDWMTPIDDLFDYTSHKKEITLEHLDETDPKYKIFLETESLLNKFWDNWNKK